MLDWNVPRGDAKAVADAADLMPGVLIVCRARDVMAARHCVAQLRKR